jgi:quercetin dioxygenase-like cupin family protein
MDRAHFARARTAACIGTLVGVATFWIAHAQQQTTDATRFTGVSQTLELEGWRVSRRSFEPGARTAWHRHGGGQLLFVESGRARVQERGGTMRELATAQTHWTAPNVEHWHGATPDTEFRQVALSRGDTSETVWLELVTDAQYQGR